MGKKEAIKMNKCFKKGRTLIRDIQNIITLFDEQWVFASSESEGLKLKVVEETLGKIRAVMLVAFINDFKDCEAYLPCEIKEIIKRQESIIEEKKDGQEKLQYS